MTDSFPKKYNQTDPEPPEQSKRHPDRPFSPENPPAGRYDDIIDLPHPVSRKHPRMPLAARAAQFAPFAALTGHSDAIEETERQQAKRME